MTQKKLRPVPAVQSGPGLGIGSSSAAFSGPEFSASSTFRQGSIDVVGLLAARSGVATASIRAQLAAWQIGGGL